MGLQGLRIKWTAPNGPFLVRECVPSFLEQKLAMKQGHIRFNGVGDLCDVSGPIVTTLCSLVQIKLAAVHKNLAINNFNG